MQHSNEVLIYLKQWFSTSQHAKTILLTSCPLGFNRAGKVECRAISPSLRTIGPNKVGIAELADRMRPVDLAAGPEIATCKSAKHRSAPDMAAFPLQREEYFLDCVIAHQIASFRSGSRVPDWAYQDDS